MPSDPEARMAYAGFCRCGAMVTATLDEPAKRDRTASELAEWVREGLTVERIAAARVRSEFGACTCAKARREQQQELFHAR